MKNKTRLEEKKSDVLRRLNGYDLENCINWGVSAPKPESKDKFQVSLVVRPELIDVPVTIIIKQGIRAEEAVEAMDYVAEIIADANKTVIRDKASKRVDDLGYFFWLSVHFRAVITGLFRLPGHGLSWVIDRITGHFLKK